MQSFFTILFFLFACTLTAQATLNASPRGNDEGNCQGPAGCASLYNTYEQASRAPRPVTIVIAAGTYRECELQLPTGDGITYRHTGPVTIINDCTQFEEPSETGVTVEWLVRTTSAAPTVGDNLILEVLSSTIDGLQQVDLYYDGTYVRTERLAAYQWNWTKDSALRNVQGGLHLIDAYLYFSGGSAPQVFTYEFAVDGFTPGQVVRRGETVSVFSPEPTRLLDVWGSPAARIEAGANYLSTAGLHPGVYFVAGSGERITVN